MEQPRRSDAVGKGEMPASVTDDPHRPRNGDDRPHASDPSGKAEFANWSGSMRFVPAERLAPSSEEELVELVRRAGERGGTVRPVGSGHSSTPLVATDDVLVSLENLSGVSAADPDGQRVIVLPGTGIADLGGQLAEHGLGMENLGDVDYQSIAGAIGTGTHGSGKDLGTFSSTMIGGRLVTGTGEVVPFGVDAQKAGPARDASAADRANPVQVPAPGGDEPPPDDPLLRAAQVSLGALGILSSVTLRLRPAYELHRINWMTHIDWVLDNFAELLERNRSVDFYWYPRSDLAQVRMLNEPGQAPELRPPGRLKREETGPSYRIIPNQRELRFEEMEYMLPLDTSLQAFREARERIKRRHRSIVGWRVLVRAIAPDGAMLGPTYRRPTLTIALLQNATLPHREYFGDMEPLLRGFGGRPHWGKKHSLTGAELRGLYPEWDAFQRIRSQLDPGRVFMNEYLDRLLETGP